MGMFSRFFISQLAVLVSLEIGVCASETLTAWVSAMSRFPLASLLLLITALVWKSLSPETNAHGANQSSP